MTESVKTTTFLVFAAALLAAAWFARPATPGRTVVDDKGEPFFADFNDPLAAATLKIMEYDEAAGSPAVFEVARHDGVWSIPSHENYPADAENQFADAVASMIGLVRGTRVSDRPADHELYGVVDPATAGPGAAGVGQRVSLLSDEGRPVADLIVGKGVKDSDTQRYVRLPDRDRVYLCVIDTEKFVTDFGQWIEKDLLELNPSDITSVVVNDYSIDEINNRILQGGELTLGYDGTKAEWTLADLTAEEALDRNRLNTLRTALDQLEIVDVHRKPAGLSSELRAAESMRLDSEAVQSLQRRGYFIVQGRLLSNKGETIVRTKQGLIYNLRFGEIAMTPGATDEAGETSNTGRYLFVTVEFDESLLPQPEFVEVPTAESLGIATEGDDAASETLQQAVTQARQRAETENAQKQAEFDRAVADGRQRASELNARFADWYYVISDNVYQDIRLTRADVVTAAPSDEAAEPAPSG